MDRTPAMVIDLIRQRAFERVFVGGEEQDPIPMSVWFDHVADNWKGWIEEDRKSGGPLSGTIDNLIGCPDDGSAEWNNWLRLAGDKDAIAIGDDDDFDGELDNDVDPGDEDRGEENENDNCFYFGINVIFYTTVLFVILCSNTDFRIKRSLLFTTCHYQCHYFVPNYLR